MTNRKKRLKKGVESLQKQIVIHEEKKKLAEEGKNYELVAYYKREIEAKKKAKEEKKDILER